MVALKLTLGDSMPTYADLASALGLSASEVHASVQRLAAARLFDPTTKQIRREALRNFIVHGVPYAFPARLGEVTRGMKTSWASSVMEQSFVANDQLPPVWPDAEGAAQGVAVEPLYPSAPGAARKDSRLYGLLAMVDALRVGRARERAFAEKKLEEEFSPYGDA